MSFGFKGGYDSMYRHIVNVSLRRTNIWKNGRVSINGIKYNIVSDRENRLEVIKYDDMNSLLLNNAIIYQNRIPFMYDLDLDYNIDNNNVHNFSNKNIYNFVDFNIVNYNTMDAISSQRTLN